MCRSSEGESCCCFRGARAGGAGQPRLTAGVGQMRVCPQKCPPLPSFWLGVTAGAWLLRGQLGRLGQARQVTAGRQPSQGAQLALNPGRPREPRGRISQRFNQPPGRYLSALLGCVLSPPVINGTEISKSPHPSLAGQPWPGKAHSPEASSPLTS